MHWRAKAFLSPPVPVPFSTDIPPLSTTRSRARVTFESEWNAIGINEKMLLFERNMVMPSTLDQMETELKNMLNSGLFHVKSSWFRDVNVDSYVKSNKTLPWDTWLRPLTVLFEYRYHDDDVPGIVKQMFPRARLPSPVKLIANGKEAKIPIEFTCSLKNPGGVKKLEIYPSVRGYSRLSLPPCTDKFENAEEVTANSGGLRNVDRLASLKKLVKVNVAYNAISSIWNMKGMESLKVLIANHNRIDAADWIEAPGIDEMDLSFNPLPSESCAATCDYVERKRGKEVQCTC